MSDQSQATQVEEVLEAYLKTEDQTEADWLLEHLISEHALPLIRKIIKSELPSRHLQDSDDIAGEVVVRLVRKIRLSKANVDRALWSNFSGYVAVTTYNECYQRLREQYPERTRFKKRLRYILTRQRGLALWTSGTGERICGFEVWQHENRPPCPRGLLQMLRDDRQVASRADQLSGSPRGDGIAELLAAVFDFAGNPMRFDDLVDVVADLLRIKDIPFTEDEGRGNPAQPDQATFAVEAEQRDYLRGLWAEICALPLDQRRALLLNLRDDEGGTMTPLIVHARIASIRQLAEALAMPAEEFAEMFGRLPLNDLNIGELIGASRQRVINLRKAARRRLSRRMARLDLKQR